jgi:hypothetical protein
MVVPRYIIQTFQILYGALPWNATKILRLTQPSQASRSVDELGAFEAHTLHQRDVQTPENLKGSPMGQPPQTRGWPSALNRANGFHEL